MPPAYDPDSPRRAEASVKFEKFIHERFLNSNDAIKDIFGLGGIAIRILEQSAKLGVPVSPNVIGGIAVDFGLDLERNAKHKMFLSSLIKEITSNDIMMLSFQITRLCCFPEPAPSYVIGKDFFEDLAEIDISRVNFSFLPEKARGLIKFPKKLKDDGFSCEFDEIMFVIDDIKNIFADVPEKISNVASEIKTSGRFLGFARHTPNKKYRSLDPWHMIIQIPLDNTVKIRDAFRWMDFKNRKISPTTLEMITFSKEGDHYHDCNRLILTTLVYILSGQPDLRDFKNPIRYQSLTSKTPVRADKGLSRVKINLVGYNWKKLPRYNQAVWNVRPFPRMQPYGPGRSQLKLILVREHQRKRRKSSDPVDGPE
jgi:hypothetical protein